MSTSAFSVDAIITEQSGLATREQLWRAGVAESHVRNQARAGRWQVLNDRVICTHNGRSLTSRHDGQPSCRLRALPRFAD
jgi:hypothetical protein